MSIDQMRAWFASYFGVVPNMLEMVFGEQVIAVGADPDSGKILLGLLHPDGSITATRISAVQCEDFLRRVSAAKDIVETGVGSMRS